MPIQLEVLVFILGCVIFYAGTTTAFLPQQCVKSHIVAPIRSSDRIQSPSRINHRSMNIRRSTRTFSTGDGYYLGNGGDDNYFNSGSGGNNGNSGNGSNGGGGRGGDDSNGGDGFRGSWGGGDFNGDPRFILGSLPFALAEKYKRDMKRKALSTVTNASTSRLFLSARAASPVSSLSPKDFLINRSISYVQSFQYATTMSFTNAKFRSTEYMKWYLTELERNPLFVKSISSGFISTIADFAAQAFEQRNNKLELLNQGRKKYDTRRLGACFAEGLFISGPLMHFGYDYFERIIPVQSSLGRHSNVAAITHVLADCVFLDSVFVATKILTTGLLEGHSLRNVIIPEFQNDYRNTMMASWVTSTGLFPLEFICFRYLPISLRTLSMNMTSILWDGVVSYKAHESRL